MSKFSKIIIFFILAVLVGGGFYWSYGTNGSNRTNYKTNKSNKTDKSYKLPKEVPLKNPIPLLWTDDNKGENLIIQSDRHYYDGSTNSTVYFAITNQSGKDQKMKVNFEFKGKGKLSLISSLPDGGKTKKGGKTPSPTLPLKGGGGTEYSFSDTLPKNKTNFYQAKIEYPKGAKGEFIIIAQGDQGGYGKLDPYFSSGLVGYWSFNGQDVNGTTAYDRSGQGNDGTIYGATPAIGKSGQALSFDGKDDYVDCGNDESLDITDAFTIEAWIYPKDAGATNFIVDKDGGSGNRAFALTLNSTHIDFEHWNASGSYVNAHTDNGVINSNNWYYVVGVYDGSNARVYINSVRKSSMSQSGGTYSVPTQPVLIGQRYNSGYFNGLIDEVRIYNRVLSASEIAEHYRVGEARLKPNTPLTNRFTNGLVGYWSFNGQDVNGTTAYDRSGQGNNGTIYGATPAIGKSGQALSFDGKDDYVDCGNDASLDIDTFTVEAWIKLTSLGRNHSIWGGFNNSGDTKNYFAVNSSNQLNLDQYPPSGGTSWTGPNNVLTVGVWYHVAVVQNGSSYVEIYLNGVLDKETNNPEVYSGPAPQVWGIGARYYNSSWTLGLFHGLIDEVRIYNRALSASEIAEHYRVGAARLKPNTPLTNRFTNGLVGYWSFNGQDIKGGTAYDRSGQDNNGTIHGATPAIGKSGQALSFDGKDDYVEVPDSSSLRLTDALTIEAWVKPIQLKDYSSIATKFASGYHGYRFMWMSTGQLKLGVADSDGAYQGAGSDGVVTTDVFQHVAVTKSGTAVNFYINGVNIGSRTLPSAEIGTSTNAFKIGYEGNNAVYLHGLIDEVRIYNRALSASEIAEHYRTESARFKIKK